MLELYYHPVSFYSKKVVLALAAKKLDFEPHVIDLGNGGTYTPEYMGMNPLGQVPVLKDGDTIIADSANIVHYLDNKYGGPKLFPAPDTATGKLIVELESQFNNISMYGITFGSFYHPDIAPNSQIPEQVRQNFAASIKEGGKIEELLQRYIDENPDMAEIYRAKLEGTRAKKAKVRDRVFVDQEVAAMKSFMDKVEIQLTKKEAGTWMFGEDITIVDITLAIAFKRLNKIGMEKLVWKDGNHTKLEQYEKKMATYEALNNIDSLM